MGGERLKQSDGTGPQDRDAERRLLEKALAELRVRLLAADEGERDLGKRTAVDDILYQPAVDTPTRPAIEKWSRSAPWQSRRPLEPYLLRGLSEVIGAIGPTRLSLQAAVLAAADPSIVPRRPTMTAPTAAGQSMWRAAERRAATLYRQAADTGDAASEDPIIDEALARLGAGHPLPDALRTKMEAQLGTTLTRVRVHTDDVAAAAARAVHARAFTVGEDIFFAAGAFAPETRDGQKLLAHELAHVVQGQQGRTRAGRGGEVSTPGDSLEREADAIAERIDRRMQRASRHTTRRRTGDDDDIRRVQPPIDSRGAEAELDGSRPRHAATRYQPALSSTAALDSNTATAAAAGTVGRGEVTGTIGDGGRTHGRSSSSHRAHGAHAHAAAHARITHSVVLDAPGNSSVRRTTIGVGEGVLFSSTVSGSWRASAARPGYETGTGTDYDYYAPARPGTVTITFDQGAGTHPETLHLHVVAPHRIRFRKTSTPAQSAAGVAMICDLEFLPRTVSFGECQWLEDPSGPEHKTGYFRHIPASIAPALDHQPETAWLSINADNKGINDTAGIYGFPRIGTPPRWSNGSFHWRIPNRYRVADEGGAGEVFTHITQAFRLFPDGTMTVSKGGQSARQAGPASTSSSSHSHGRRHGHAAHTRGFAHAEGTHDDHINNALPIEDSGAADDVGGESESAEPMRDGGALETEGKDAKHDVEPGKTAPATEGTGTLGLGTIGKTVVNPVKSVRHDRLALLGDGAANKGLTCRDLDTYVTAQADWFHEPSLTPTDRDNVWKVLLLLREGSHVLAAIGSLYAAEVAALGAPDKTKLKKYAACFNADAESPQGPTVATTKARALQLGQALTDLEAFIPLPVLRVVIPGSGLIWLVDNGKIPELQAYYKAFKPTLEIPAEWPHLQTLLNEGVAKYAALASWVHDLHIFTPKTRLRLVANVADRSRSRPVMLVLMSGHDHNGAFLQGLNLEGAVLNSKNLALVVQGPPSIAAATSEVNRVADDYGQQTKTWSWKDWKYNYSKGRLGQVVIAGHGSDQSVEMASPGTGAKANDKKDEVSYDGGDVDSSDPKKNGTELLIDTVLSRMDPKDANVVFAGCLVGSHEIPATTNVSGGSAAAQANLQAALAAHPNLSDYVRARMAAAGVKGEVHAANGSTTFSSFNVDPATGKARLSNPGDPDISGTKLQYLRTGNEPEGALKAAIECYADAAIGPATTTSEIRARVAGLAGNKAWWQTITRVGFELALPAAPADVDIAKLLDLSHRISWWFGGLWDDVDIQSMVNSTRVGEETKVFPAMLGTTEAGADHIQVGVNEAWIQFDASKTAAFMTALTASSLDRASFRKLYAPAVIDKHLATLLPVGAPTKGQMILALTVAAEKKAAMPAAVRTFLRAAAGGTTTSTFPAALNAATILAPTSELEILEYIGLAPKSAPPAVGGVTKVDGNVDANHNNKNETFIEVSPREATVNVAVLNVRRMASTASTIIDTVKSGDTLRVMGETSDGWAFIDHGGKTGFVKATYIT